MVKLEQAEFKSKESFKESLPKWMNGEERFQSYTDKDGNIQRKKIISKNHLYLGNGYSINLFHSKETGKVYISIHYLGVEDRINIARNRKENQNSNQGKTNNKDYSSEELEI